MDIDYRILEAAELQLIRKKLTIIRFFGFNLKPFSLGVAARYINYRKHWDEYYLHENELELKAFLDYILNDGICAKQFLIESHTQLYNIAIAILNKNIPELVIENEEWKMIKLFLDYIDTNNDDNLNQLSHEHPNGEVICQYLKFVTTKSLVSKQYLEDRSLYALAFAESLLSYNEMALDSLLIKDRTRGNMKSTLKNNQNSNILFNFTENERSNVECLFVKSYDINLMQFLDSNIQSFQKHASFEKFLNSELQESYQYIDLCDISIIDEAQSAKLFQRIRGKVKIIVYDSSKLFHVDLFKHCPWLRTYTWEIY